MDRKGGKGVGVGFHILVKVSGLSRWGSLETELCRKDGNARSHDSSQRHPSLCVCARVRVWVYNDVIPSVLWLSGADRQGLCRSNVFISTTTVMECCEGGGAAV